MAPGTWAELPTGNIQALFDNGASGHILTYSSSMSWDPTAHRMHFVGNDHHGGDASKPLKWVYYDDATNAWVRATPNPPNWAQHGDDHLTIDQDGRVLYLLQTAIGNVPIVVSSLSLAGGGWQSLRSGPPGGYLNVTIGTDFFPGLGYVVYNCGKPGGELRLRNAAGVWSAITGFGGSGGYGCVAEFSRAHNVLIVGGGPNPRRVWRLNENRKVAAMPDAPFEYGSNPGQGIVAADPVTGHFIFLGNQAGGLWELDPRGRGTWRQLSATPPANLEGWQGAVVGAVSNYGVLMYASCQGQNCHVHLYKHRAGGPPPSKDTPSPTVSLTAPTAGAQSKLNGDPLGAEVAVSPQSLSADSGWQ